MKHRIEWAMTLLALLSCNCQAKECSPAQMHALDDLASKGVGDRDVVQVNWTGASRIASEGEDIRITIGRGGRWYFLLDFAGSMGLSRDMVWIDGRNILRRSHERDNQGPDVFSLVDAAYYCGLDRREVSATDGLKPLDDVLNEAAEKGVTLDPWKD